MARNDPLASVSLRATPQTRQAPGHPEQIRDNAGGYVFAKDLMEKLEDFLVLGVTGGTFYVSQDKLVRDNIGWLLEAVAADGAAVVDAVVDKSASTPPKAVKNRACVFTLAMVFAKGDPQAVQAAKAAFPKVVRTTFDLAMFFGYSKELRGKADARGGTSLTYGRALRSALGSWFTDGDVPAVAWKACKARQRKTPAGEAFALRDALRVSHVKADSPQRAALLGWLAGTVEDADAREAVPAIDMFLTAQAVRSEAEAVRVARDRRVPWEHIPSEFRTAPVWEALVPHLGMTALLRNLALMTRLGALRPGSETVRTAVRRLTDTDAVRGSRIHPMDVLLALRVYNSGISRPNPREMPERWAPVAEISDALEEMYDLSFGHVEPSGRRLLVAVDSSGSMRWDQVTMGGSPLGSAYEVASSMAVLLKRVEGANAHVIDIDTSVHASRVTARTNLREVSSWLPSGGGTDLSLPFSHALAQRIDVDGFVVLTDGETWAGRQHPFQALDAYRRTVNPSARVVVASMCPTGHTIAEPGDPGVLNIAGMDSSLPRVVTQFIRGR